MRSNLAYIVLVAGLLLTSITAHFAYERSSISADYRFSGITQEINADIAQRFQVYLNTLHQTRGLILINPDLDRTMFEIYTSNLNLPGAYPGIMGIGYGRLTRATDFPELERKLKNEYENPQINIWADSTGHLREEAYVVRAFSPEMNPVGGKFLVGFDLSSEKARREAIETARDTGLPTLSNRILLVQDAKKDQPGFLYVLPVYRRGAKTDSIADRRRAMLGVVYIAFRAGDLFAGIFGGQHPSPAGIDFHVYEGRPIGNKPPPDENLLYDNDPTDTEDSSYHPSHQAVIPFDVGGRTLTLRVYSLPSFEADSLKLTPVIIIVTGLLLSFISFRALLLHEDQQELIAKSERQLKLITDALPVLISYLDTRERYHFNNKAYEDWFLRSRSEIQGKHMRDVVGARNYERVRPYIEQALRGEAVSFESEWEIFDGSFHPILASYVPDFGSGNHVKGIVILVTDISARKRQETNQRLLADLSAVLGSSLDTQATLQRLASLVTPSLADWCTVDILDDHGQVQRVAASVADPAKRAALEQIRNRPPNEASTEKGAAFVIRTGEPKLVGRMDPADFRSQARDASELDALTALGANSGIFVPMKARGRVLGAISLYASSGERRFSSDDLVFAQEIARRAALAMENAKLFRDAQFANRAKDEFLATLSHELRTPMNVILGWLEILSNEHVDRDTYEQALATLTRNARVQIQLINDLLDISRIISGKLTLNMQQMDLTAVAVASVDGLRPAARAKNITIKLELPRGELRLNGDADRIQQVLWNLLSNAVKFTPEGGRIIARVLPSPTALKIEIEDNGQGIDPRFIPYVFDRFRQEDSSTTRVQGGLGIGLAIVRYLVELHGGSVEARSEGRGHGSVFTCTLPRGRQALDNTQKPEPSPGRSLREHRRELGGLSILLVDDSPDVRTLISRILIRAGARVTAVGSAPEAFEYLSHTRPDVLISDIGLPDEDGFSLIARIRRLEASLNRAPVPAAALTAYAQESDAKKSLEAGYDCHLAKPVSSADLLQTVAVLAGRTISSEDRSKGLT